MGDELVDFCADEVLPQLIKQHKEYKDYYVHSAGYTKLKRWAYAEWEERVLNHAYEEPWRIGWMRIAPHEGKEDFIVVKWYLRDDGGIIIKDITIKRDHETDALDDVWDSRGKY